MKLTHVLLLFLVLISCEEDDNSLLDSIDKLPPLTMEGKNTFGCLVNGEAFVPRISTDVVGIFQGGFLQIGASVETIDRDQNIKMILDMSPILPGIYSMETADTSLAKADFDDTTDKNNICRYEFSDLVSGTLEIVFFRQDPDVVAGTFEFTTVTEGCDTIRVTDGRFDIDFIQ